MRKWWFAAFGAGVYAFALIIGAPATLIDAGLRQASEGRLRLAEARGSLWSGSGQIEFRDAERRSGIASSIVWQVAPAQLLRGKLLYNVTLGQSIKGFPVSVSLSQTEVTDADVTLPAAALGLFMPKLVPLALGGDLLLHVGRISFGRGTIQGDATLQWRAAASEFAPVSPLGDYELRLEGDGATVRATLRTLQGALRLDGRGSWPTGGNPVFLITARIPPQHQQQLAPLMRLIAVERADGSFTLQ